jgi:hypothetical protein
METHPIYCEVRTQFIYSTIAGFKKLIDKTRLEFADFIMRMAGQEMLSKWT